MTDRVLPIRAGVGGVTAEAGSVAPEPGHRATEPGAVPELDDRLARAIGIPAFGLGIPRVTGLLDGVAIASPRYWLGTALFVALAAAIWQGNRWLLFEQRRHWGWFDHPVRKVVMLGAAIVLFTAPLTIATLAAWDAWRGAPPAWPAIQTVALMNVVCVVFVTHVYETVFLIHERRDDQLRLARTERARAEAELAAFLAQVDPHFIFNSLNTLGHLIETDPARAREFTDRLAELHRYLLRHRGRAAATLADELRFLDDYVALMRVRFGDALVVDVDADAAGVDPHAVTLPPTALQLLVENAVKHNEVGEGRPLAVTVTVRGGAVEVANPRRPRRTLRPSAGIGLANLDERARLGGGRGIAIDDAGDRFVVTVPLEPR